MTLKHLEYVIEVSNSKSIYEASSKLFISQPSLSRAIKELEDELGFQIFVRSNKGIYVTVKGQEFIGYARQVIEQNKVLEEKYFGGKKSKAKFCVSSQHYSFVVNAFADLFKEYGDQEYEFTLRETKTYEILDDLKMFRSDVGILFLNEFNKKVFEKNFKDYDFEFVPLFKTTPHVFISNTHPLASKKVIALEELSEYPYLTFEQGVNNSFYYSEEVISILDHKKNIKVSDRATLFNLLIALDGYTISTGIIDSNLNGKEIISVKLACNYDITVGYIKQKNISLSPLAVKFVNNILKYIPK